MNSRQLQYAVLLSQTLNFSLAAEQLGISQPSLSKQILSLENELDVRLFERSTPLTLTPAGEYFIREAKELLYREDQLRHALEQFRCGESGRLVIGVSPFRSLYLMPKVVRELKERFPGVQVVLHESTTAQLRKGAAEGKYDLAIVNLPVDSSVLEVTPMEPDALVLAVPKSLLPLLPAHARDETQPLDLADAGSLPFVVLGPSQELRQQFDRLCAAAELRPSLAAEVVGITTAWAMAHAGVGAALLPLQFVSAQQFDENLVLFSIGSSDYSRQPAVIRKRGQYLSPYAACAIRLLTGQEGTKFPE